LSDPNVVHHSPPTRCAVLQCGKLTNEMHTQQITLYYRL
jgi:hypothetical protein